MDYQNHLVLYSGGADSTYFIEHESTARYLRHYKAYNEAKTKVAMANALRLNRYLNIVPWGSGDVECDGEVGSVQALYDTEMALNASIHAAGHGFKGIVMCFNADDSGIDQEAVVRIMRRAEPDFELLTPLKDTPAKQIRDYLKKNKIRYVSCMYSLECDFCPKCVRGY